MEGTGVKGQRVLFDVLKERSSASFHRHVQDTKPPSCAWQSLAMALHHGFGHQDVDKASKSGEAVGTGARAAEVVGAQLPSTLAKGTEVCCRSKAAM